MKAKIHLAGDMLVAKLESGSRLSNIDTNLLADLLWAQNVTASEVTTVDWHEDADRAPLNGQKVAIYQRLRLHERSLEDRTSP
jgi:hypothetical protein